MNAVRNTLAAVAFFAAIIASVGAAMIRPEVMGIGGIVAALAATGWGLLKGLGDLRERHRRVPFTSEVVHYPAKAFTVIEGGREPEWRARERRSPFWDTDIFGAPE